MMKYARTKPTNFKTPNVIAPVVPVVTTNSLIGDFSNSEGTINIHKYSATHFFALVITILISIASGFVTGFIIKFCNCKSTSKYFDDHEFFDITESEHFPKENENPVNQVNNQNQVNQINQNDEEHKKKEKKKKKEKE